MAYIKLIYAISSSQPASDEIIPPPWKDHEVALLNRPSKEFII